MRDPLCSNKSLDKLSLDCAHITLAYQKVKERGVTMQLAMKFNPSKVLHITCFEDWQ
jgi:hypothetical protein